MVPPQDVSGVKHTLNNAWDIQLGRDVCSQVQAGLNYEWLVTNGLGGYAAGSIEGATTRSYHGLLVAALKPPVERTVLVAKIDEEVTLPGEEIVTLGVNEYYDGTIDPQGHQFLMGVSLEADIPCFRYQLNEQLVLEKRIWMEYGQNTTYVQYTLHGELPQSADDALSLTLVPFCLSRDHHTVTQGSQDWQFIVDAQENRCRIRAYNETPVYHLIAGPSAFFSPTGLWYWNVLHRHDVERGLPGQEDVFQPGIFRMPLAPGTPVSFVLTAEKTPSHDFGSAHHEEAVAEALQRHHRRVKQVLATVDCSTDDLQQCDAVLARLALAADQFIVARSGSSSHAHHPGQISSPDHTTVIAGYPWFTDWGRDSMIALPGLFLCTGRHSEARDLLKAFVSFLHQGLIPNHFPSQGETPQYNTVDATLWLFYALDRYLKATDDWTLLEEIFPTLQESIQWHVHGTLYNIGVDPNDGLLYEGEPGLQLTWMDAKIEDVVVTPRSGKPVEVNALWYYALTSMEAWAKRLSADATPYQQLHEQLRRHFAERFWYEAGGYLYDVVDVDGITGQHDTSLRPNQLIAASLTADLLSPEQVASIFHVVTEHLLTPTGLRTLSPTDPAYHDHFHGNHRQRDSSYHQGTVWQWLIGPYVDVHLALNNDRQAIRSIVSLLLQQLWEACLGTISEVAEPEPPFAPAGCFAQAWSVAEALRCWRLATMAE